MQWKLSEEQQAYQESIRGWLAQVAPPGRLRGWLEDGDAFSFERRLSADGWLAVGTAEEAGGQGGGMVELALTAEELARAGVPSAAWLASILAISALTDRAGVSAPVVTGPDPVAAALAGEVIALLVPAEVVPDKAAPLTMTSDGRVSGTVPRVLAGDLARRFIVPVDTAAGCAFRLVEADAAGVLVKPRRLLDRTRSVADVTLESAPSASIAVDAETALEDVSRRAAVLVAADALGALAKMLELTVEYSKQRHQFGVPIASFQAVKHAAAAMLVSVEAARSIVYFAAASVGQGHADARMHAAAAKAQVTADAAHSADTALTVHGAIGYTWEHELQVFYKRAKLDAQLYGDAAVWNERIASDLSLTLVERIG